ncbi:MAG: hypothetical protein R2828_28045 [Saprospiraceae bacterium]
MHRKIAVACIVLNLGFFTTIFAQNAVVTTPKSAEKVSQLLASTSNAIESQDWTIFRDEENELYYIDFEAIKVNISNVVVKDEQQNILFQDDVFDLPVNTIYELDLSAFQAGKYRIELQTFTNIIAKNIELK